MSNRSYNQYCGLAYALDKVGERWTLLIVRELVAGPRRFTDLMDGLPGISTNLLTTRLKDLEQRGLVKRRILLPPAGSTVYELTAMGRGLEPALLELGRWGSQFVPPTWGEDALLHLGSYALTFKTFFREDQAQDVYETYELHIDNDVLQVQVQDGAIDVRQGQMSEPDATFYLGMEVFMALMARRLTPDEALAQGLVQVKGEPAALHRLLDLCGLPLPAQGAEACLPDLLREEW